MAHWCTDLYLNQQEFLLNPIETLAHLLLPSNRVKHDPNNISYKGSLQQSSIDEMGVYEILLNLNQ